VYPVVISALRKSTSFSFTHFTGETAINDWLQRRETDIRSSVWEISRLLWSPEIWYYV